MSAVATRSPANNLYHTYIISSDDVLGFSATLGSTPWQATLPVPGILCADRSAGNHLRYEQSPVCRQYPCATALPVLQPNDTNSQRELTALAEIGQRRTSADKGITIYNFNLHVRRLERSIQAVHKFLGPLTDLLHRRTNHLLCGDLLPTGLHVRAQSHFQRGDCQFVDSQRAE